MWCFKLTAVRFLLACVFLFKGIHGHENGNGPDVVTVIAKQGSDVILPCSLSTKESIESKLFDWKKDGRQEVFLYDAGTHYNNKLSGQDEQFKGRVSHFPEGLKSGNASIMIQNTKMEDSGVYTCDFPHLQPRQLFQIKLVVGAAPKPSIKIVDKRANWALLQCEVLGASPKPEVNWTDGVGNIFPAREPKVTERGGRYDIILNITVTKTDMYHCVATQEEIGRQIHAETYVFISGMFEDECSRAVWMTGGWFIGIITAAAVWGLFKVADYIIKCRKKGPPQTNGFYTVTSRDPVNSPVC